MANPSDRLPLNVAGPYYVDDSCIDCDLCRSTAPEFFKRDDESGYSIVYRQPLTPAEVELAGDAMSGCPTGSIGNDGEPAHLERDKENSSQRGVLRP
jgi:ferredoxin